MTTSPTTCTIGSHGNRCGAPAVTTFVGSNGTVYAECAAHAVHIAPRTTGHAVGDTVEVRRYGKVYRAVITRVGRGGAAYATFTYGNGATRTARV